MNKKNSIAPSIFILILMVSLGPFGDTIYAPALPKIQQAFNTNYSNVQLTISFYLMGYSISQVIYGPLSDKFGRKPIMLIGASLFLASSIVCLLSYSVPSLLIGRFIQGFGASAGGVLSTAAICESFSLKKQASIFAKVNIAFALAPGLGALIGVFIDMHTIFILLVIASTILLFSVMFYLPETIKHYNKKALTPHQLFINYFYLFKDHQFVICTLVLGLNISIIYGSLIEIPDIFINMLNISKSIFLVFLASLIISVIFGSVVCSHLAKKVSFRHLINFGLTLTTISGVLLFVCFKYCSHETIIIILPIIMSLTFVGISFVVPTITPIALENFSKTVGSASAIMGFMQMGIASLFTAFASRLPFSGTTSLSGAITFLPIVCLIIFLPYSFLHLKHKKIKVPSKDYSCL